MLLARNSGLFLFLSSTVPPFTIFTMKNNYTYRFYNLYFNSSIELPNLVGALQPNHKIADVKIQPVAKKISLEHTEYKKEFPSLTYSIGTLDNKIATLIDLQNVARYYIIDGKEIHYQRYENSPDNDFQSYLCSLAIVAILFQRGYFILHASAVATPHGAFVFFGKSGAGKTTTTAGFSQRGYKILSEDVTVVKIINQQPHVLPAVPYLKLGKETTELLNLDWHQMPTLFSDQEKRAFILQQEYQSQAIPLNSIYFLNALDVDELTFNQEIGYEEKFGLIADNIHYKKFFMGYPLDEIYSTLAIHLVENIPMTMVHRPVQHNTLETWLDRLEQSFLKNVQPSG